MPPSSQNKALGSAPPQTLCKGDSPVRLHLLDLDSVGLITSEIESSLSEALRDRLREVRTPE